MQKNRIFGLFHWVGLKTSAGFGVHLEAIRCIQGLEESLFLEEFRMLAAEFALSQEAFGEHNDDECRTAKPSSYV